MARTVFTLSIFSALLVWTSLAGPAPNLEKTLAVQRELVDQHPYDAKAHNDLGNLLMLAGRDAEAEQAYRRAVELDPGATAARFNLAVLLQQNGRAEEAAEEFRSVLAIDAYHGWAHYQLGTLYQQKRDRSKALESYARAFAYDPALTFASNNPDIIDNELATEALLLSQRYRSSAAARVPRHYSDPQRIAELMLEEALAEAGAAKGEPSEGLPESPTDREPAGKATGSGPGGDRPVEPQAPPAAGGRQQDRTQPVSSAPADPEGEDAGDSPTLYVATPPNRVLTPASVEEAGPANQAGSQPVRPGSPEARRQDFEQRFLRRQPPASGSDPSADAPPRAPTRTPSQPLRPRYRPGRSSTGRLDLELLPALPGEGREGGERHAAFQPARG